MADKMSISGPVKVAPTSAEAVAFDLMKEIYSHEVGKDEEQKSRDYWLTLYYQCLRATKGYTDLKSVLKAE